MKFFHHKVLTIASQLFNVNRVFAICDCLYIFVVFVNLWNVIINKGHTIQKVNKDDSYVIDMSVIASNFKHLSLVGAGGLEPPRAQCPADFKSDTSTYSVTLPMKRLGVRNHS